MSANELVQKIEELKGLEQLIKEAEQEAESIRDSIKAEMLEQGLEELTAGTHIVRWTTTAKIVAKAPFARQNRATVPEGRAIP